MIKRTIPMNGLTYYGKSEKVQDYKYTGNTGNPNTIFSRRAIKRRCLTINCLNNEPCSNKKNEVSVENAENVDVKKIGNYNLTSGPIFLKQQQYITISKGSVKTIEVNESLETDIAFNGITNNGTLIIKGSLKISEGTSIINNGKIVINGSLTNNGQIEMNKNSTLENSGNISGNGEIIFGISEYMKNVDTLKRFWGNRISFKNKEGSFSKFNNQKTTIRIGSDEIFMIRKNCKGIIDKGVTLIIDNQIDLFGNSNLINNGKLIINKTLTIYGSLDNNGSLTNNGQIEMNKNSTLENSGNISGNGEIIFGISEYMKNVDTLKRFWGNRISFKNKEGSFSKFNNQKTTIRIGSDEIFMIRKNCKGIIDKGVTLIIDNQIDLFGNSNLINNGKLIINKTLTIYGSLDNNGIIITEEATIIIYDGILNNNPRANMILTKNSKLINKKMIQNDGTIQNDDTIQNEGTIYSNGIITNAGTIENNGTLENDNTINNNGTINNGSMNNGTVTEGIIYNGGAIHNYYVNSWGNGNNNSVINNKYGTINYGKNTPLEAPSYLVEKIYSRQSINEIGGTINGDNMVYTNIIDYNDLEKECYPDGYGYGSVSCFRLSAGSDDVVVISPNYRPRDREIEVWGLLIIPHNCIYDVEYIHCFGGLVINNGSIITSGLYAIYNEFGEFINNGYIVRRNWTFSGGFNPTIGNQGIFENHGIIINNNVISNFGYSGDNKENKEAIDKVRDGNYEDISSDYINGKIPKKPVDYVYEGLFINYRNGLIINTSNDRDFDFEDGDDRYFDIDKLSTLLEKPYKYSLNDVYIKNENRGIIKNMGIIMNEPWPYEEPRQNFYDQIRPMRSSEKKRHTTDYNIIENESGCLIYNEGIIDNKDTIKNDGIIITVQTKKDTGGTITGDGTLTVISN